jgi:hypothetical protein
VNPATAAAAAVSAAQRPFDVSQLRLWNPLSGHCVPVRDPACELREVSKHLGTDSLAACCEACLQLLHALGLC